MKAVVIAQTSLLELLREKTLQVFVIIACLFIGFSFLLGALSFDEQKRILLHLGLTGIQLTSVGIALGLGSFALSKEIERQTCLLILARPIGRSDFFIGKWLGIFSTIAIFICLMGFVLAALLGFSLPGFSYGLCLWGIFLESIVLLSFAFMISQIVRASVGLFAGVGYFLMGQWLPELHYFSQKSGQVLITLLDQFLTYLVPHFYLMNSRSIYIIENNLNSDHFFNVTIHGMAWTLLLLFIGTRIFHRRDLV